jgi:nucleoside-diphosphate-sugar epimerase
VEIVVTGAGGFSGSHLVAHLLACGHKVTALCRRSLGRLDPRLRSHPALTVVTGDLTEALPLPARIEAVMHAAARSPAPGIGTSGMVRDNVCATARLFDYAKTAGARTLIYFSSLSIYGDISAPVVDETTPMVNPDVYGMTKYLGEMMLRDLPAPTRSMSIRLPGVLGPNSVRNWLTGVLAAAKEDREIACYNPQAVFNNAAHIHDLAEFVQHLLADGSWAGHNAVTVGAAETTSVQRAIGIIIETLSSRSAIRVHHAERRSFIISSELAQRYGYKAMGIEPMLARFASENRN